MPDKYLAEIGPAIKKVALATGAEQYNILQNNGKMAFQVIVITYFRRHNVLTPQLGSAR